MTKEIFQIQITLEGSKPKIWRRVLIPSDLLLSHLHKIIQTSMGWTNSHMHQFIKNGTYYTANENNMFDDMDGIDYKKKKIRISTLLKQEKDTLVYEYDFGDGWLHKILLEKILPVDDKVKYPVVVDGNMHCPPEDCGGVWGYADMLKILKKSDHEEYESYMEWLGGEFDPKYFNIDEINDMLKQKNYGVLDLF